MSNDRTFKFAYGTMAAPRDVFVRAPSYFAAVHHMRTRVLDFGHVPPAGAVTLHNDAIPDGATVVDVPTETPATAAEQARTATDAAYDAGWNAGLLAAAEWLKSPPRGERYARTADRMVARLRK